MENYETRLRERWPKMLKSPSIKPYGKASIGIFDGWFDILERFFSSIEERVLSQIEDPQDSDWPLFSVIKEKFGKIRIYYARAGSVETLDLLRRLEDEAVSTCYCCGLPGRLTVVEGLAAPRCGKCAARDSGGSLQ